MSKFTRATVIVAALAALVGAMASTAGAVTWHNTGSTAFTATGGPGTFTVGANNLACSGSSATGTAPSLSTSATYTIPGTVTFSPCTLAGQNTYVHCGYTFTGSSFSAGITFGALDVNCVARLTASNTALCNITGSTSANYYNPLVIINSGPFTLQGPGRFTLTTASTLRTTHSSGTSCLLGTGTTHVSEQTIIVTHSTPSGLLGPAINRTA